MTVPYYRDLVHRGEFDPRQIGTAAELQRLPLVEKSDLRSSPESFRSDAVDARDTASFRTSGSTGIPVEVYYDRAALALNVALGAREEAVVRTVCGRRRNIVTLRFGHTSSTGPQVREANRALMLAPRSRISSVSVEEPVDRAVEAIERVRPDVVTGYGTYLEMLFRSIGDPSVLRHRPRVLVYRGTSLSQGGRRLIEERFGITVVGRYNAVECFKIAYLCEERTGFHVHEDVCHVRVVDPAGRTLPPGEEGEVVISNLANRATVLLNYRLGDLGALAIDPCPCGRTSPRLTGLEGRVDELIRLADGRTVHPISVSIALRDMPFVRFQLEQLAADRFELRLVTDDHDSFQSVVRDAIPGLERLLGGARVDARRCERLETSGRGKLRRVLTLPEEPGRDR